MKTPFSSLLEEKKPFLGTFVQSGAPEFLEASAYAGFRYAAVDLEHTYYGVERTAEMIRAGEAADLCMLARVPCLDATWIKKCLDFGASGIIVPNVDTAEQARQQGFRPVILTNKMVGEAREQAALLVAQARRMAAELPADAQPLCLLAGGETTVTLRGGGRGGRNQEMALAASLALQDCPHVCALFAGTDGTDGPTDAAGGCAWAGNLAVTGMEQARHALEENDSYPILHHCGALLRTGPTRTNVMDLAVLLVWPEKAQ